MEEKFILPILQNLILKLKSMEEEVKLTNSQEYIEGSQNQDDGFRNTSGFQDTQNMDTTQQSHLQPLIDATYQAIDSSVQPKERNQEMPENLKNIDDITQEHEKPSLHQPFFIDKLEDQLKSQLVQISQQRKEKHIEWIKNVSRVSGPPSEVSEKKEKQFKKKMKKKMKKFLKEEVIEERVEEHVPEKERTKQKNMKRLLNQIDQIENDQIQNNYMPNYIRSTKQQQIRQIQLHDRKEGKRQEKKKQKERELRKKGHRFTTFQTSDVINRLYDHNQVKKDKVENIKEEEKQLKRQKTNKRHVNMKTNQLLQDNYIPIYKRVPEIIRVKNRRLQENAAQLQKIPEEYTFQPNITKTSMKARSQAEFIAHCYQWQQQKNIHQEIQHENAFYQDLKEATFRPELNKKTQKLAKKYKQKSDMGNKKIYDRFKIQEQERQQKLQEIKNEMTPSFQPKIISSFPISLSQQKQKSSSKKKSSTKKKKVIYSSHTGRPRTTVQPSRQQNMYDYFMSQKKKTKSKSKGKNRSPKMIGYLLGNKVETKKFQFEPEEIKVMSNQDDSDKKSSNSSKSKVYTIQYDPSLDFLIDQIS